MKKWVSVSIVIIVALIMLIVTRDQLSTRTGNRAESPFTYNLEQFAVVPDSLVTYTEALQIRVSGAIPKDLDWHHDNIYLLTNQYLQVLNSRGEERMRILTGQNPLILEVAYNGVIFVAHENHIVAYNAAGEQIASTGQLPASSLVTGMAASDSLLFVADAGTSTVRVFNHQLMQVNEFEGESGASVLHGFILPGKQFDLAIDNNGELWVTNPGIHAIQNYSLAGRLRGYWRRASFGLDGFSGCCNPSYIAFLSDNLLVTSEKGLPRIKIHHLSGEFITVVAPPGSFANGTTAPAIVADNHDNIYALDFDRNLIRLFKINTTN